MSGFGGNSGFGDGKALSGLPPLGGPMQSRIKSLSQGPTTPAMPTPGAKVPEHALEKMEAAREHMRRAERAQEVLTAKFGEFERLIGPENARRAIEEARSYATRAWGEYQTLKEAMG